MDTGGYPDVHPYQPFMEVIMSEVSRLYSSPDTIYRTGVRRDSGRGLHGDVKHTVFKDGVPVVTEIIPVKRPESVLPTPQLKKRSVVRTRPDSDRRQGDDSREETGSGLAQKKRKLQTRLKQAIAASETLWSRKHRIWLSCQGSGQFLVKRYTTDNQLISKQLLTVEEILDGSIPGIFDTGWEKV
jgi:hypothetical protein